MHWSSSRDLLLTVPSDTSTLPSFNNRPDFARAIGRDLYAMIEHLVDAESQSIFLDTGAILAPYFADFDNPKRRKKWDTQLARKPHLWSGEQSQQWRRSISKLWLPRYRVAASKHGSPEIESEAQFLAFITSIVGTEGSRWPLIWDELAAAGAYWSLALLQRERAIVRVASEDIARDMVVLAATEKRS